MYSLHKTALCTRTRIRNPRRRTTASAPTHYFFPYPYSNEISPPSHDWQVTLIRVRALHYDWLLIRILKWFTNHSRAGGGIRGIRVGKRRR